MRAISYHCLCFLIFFIRDKAYYSPKFLDCFYVQTNEWRRKIFYRGMKLFLQGLDHITNKV